MGKSSAKITLISLLKSSKTSAEIALLLGITKRYANKLREKYIKEGSGCPIHKKKRKQRKWKTDKKTENKIIELYSNEYNGFNFAHFLDEFKKHKITNISYGALYRILKESDFKSPKAHKKNKTVNIHPIRERNKTYNKY